MEKVIYNSLNGKQLEAVKSQEKYLRIIAGAGSGKTRVLTYRYMYLAEEMNISCSKILAITFTNKSAKEMKDRIVDCLGFQKYMKISTFHSFCLRFLREEIHNLGYSVNFMVIDEEDKLATIKTIAKEKDISLRDPLIKKVVNFISALKNEGIDPDTLPVPCEEEDKRIHLLKIAFFREYELTLKKLNAVDFDDLLLKALDILRLFLPVREKWQHRIDAILIDEFQDTNEVQYQLVKFLMNKYTQLFVVGDPDQGIYSFRGAKNEILLEMERDFPSLVTIILEQNYRSTQAILSKANDLINNNVNRIKKNLFSESSEGTKPEIEFLDNSEAEAAYVVKKIKKLIEAGTKPTDICILYRSHYVSRAIEQKLILNHVHYQMYGGVRFMERMEIKDAMSYLRLLISADDLSFLRVINKPKRGIGEVKFERFKMQAEAAGVSIYEFVKALCSERTYLKSKEGMIIDDFISTVERFKRRLATLDLADMDDFFSDYFTELGYLKYLDDTEDNAEERKDNIFEIYKMYGEYLNNGEESHSLAEFIEEAMLLTSSDQDEQGDAIYMMTVHIAKGLEFKNVFIISVSQGVFPNKRALDAQGNIEEERRLFYVAMTRAKEYLSITGNQDYSFQMAANLAPSVFLGEIGYVSVSRQSYSRSSDYLSRDHAAANAFSSRVSLAAKEVKQLLYQEPEITKTSYTAGDHVTHINYGNGLVVAVKETTIQIAFENSEVGLKTLQKNHPSYKKREE